MRVLYIADEVIEGGSTKCLFELVTQLKKRYGVFPVVLLCGKCKLQDQLTEAGIACIIHPYGSFMHTEPASRWKKPIKYIKELCQYKILTKAAIRHIEKKLDLSDVDLIHANINRVDIGGCLAIRNGIPHIQHIREFGDLHMPCWSYVDNPGAYISSYSDATITVSDAVKEYWVKRKGLDRESSYRIYDGIDQSSFHADHKQRFAEMRIVMTGTLLESKGQMTLVRALASLDDEIKQHVTVDIIGDGSSEYKSELCHEINALGLCDRVNLLGHIENIADILPRYDIGIVGSRAEGFGRVTVEYMASGLAVIATGSGANREILCDNEGDFGFFYDFGDHEALASQIQFLYSEPYVLASASRRGIDRSKSFTCEANADYVYLLYKKVIASHGSKLGPLSN